MSAALALDAADGVIDGRHFGRPIVQAGQPQLVGAAPAYFGGAQQFVGASYPATFGTQFGGFAQPTVFGGASSAALALDAADGVIDGKSFGRPIIQAGAPAFTTQFGGYPTTQFGGYTQAFAQPTVFGAQQFVGGASSAALALDAADGVIDGKSFGRPIIQAGAPAFGTQFVGQQFVGAAPAYFGGAQQFVGAPQFASYGTQFGGFAQPAVFGGASSAALALDAADGVIDGKSFGRPIVQAGGVVPFSGVQQFGYPTQFAAAPAVVAAPAAYGFQGVPAQYYGQQRFAGFQGVPQYGFPGSAAQKAAQLDAADGVIDGKHFGRPIVQRR